MLLAFLPCETVIIAKDNTTSLITLLEQLKVPIPTEELAKLPPDAGAPKIWNVFTLWQRLNEDEGKKFEQRFVLALPDGKEIITAVQPFEFTPGIEHFRNVVNIQGFPLGGLGVYRLKLSLREAKVNGEWTDAAEYPLSVVYGAGDASS